MRKRKQAKLRRLSSSFGGRGSDPAARERDPRAHPGPAHNEPHLVTIPIGVTIAIGAGLRLRHRPLGDHVAQLLVRHGPGAQGFVVEGREFEVGGLRLVVGPDP